MKGIFYRGKKFPFKYDNPNTGEVVLDTREVIWLENKAADFLVETSPSDFVLSGDTEPDDPKAKLGLKEFTCKKCGHVSYGRSDASKHQHQCKGLSDGDSLNGADAA